METVGVQEDLKQRLEVKWSKTPEKAIENNELDEKRFENYIKLKKELKYLSTRKDTKTRRANERKFSKMVKEFKKLKNRNKGVK